MAQTYSAANILMYQTGKQSDVAIADGASATSATEFLSLTSFVVANAVDPLRLEDAEGNRSTHSHVVIAERSYPFSGGGTIEVDKIGTLLYYATGVVTSTQDASTGAYEHVYAMMNNVILPKFTLFFGVDGENNGTQVGYRRLKGCQISSLTITVSDTEATFSFDGFATGEDGIVNSTTAISPTNVTDIEYQSDGLIRYTMSTTTLSAVSNGDVLDTSGSSGISNASNIGQFIIVNVNDGSDYVDVINPNRSDNVDDETTITATGVDIDIVTPAAYAEPSGILLRRHSAVKDVAIGGDLDAATENELSGFTFTINNNSVELRESAKSPDPTLITAGLIEVESTFTQVINTIRGAKAISYKTGEGVVRSWRLELEDTNILLGTSTTYSPLMELDMLEAMGIATRTNQHSGDLLAYDWVLNTSEQQGIAIKLRNEIASYG